MLIRQAEVLKDPQGTRRQILEELPGVHITRTLTWRRGVEFEATFKPMVAQRREGYKDEQSRVLVPWQGPPLAYPRGPRRQWKHRNPAARDLSEANAWMAESLCLWYPRDPRPLRWDWDDGIVAFFDRLHLHLLMEEQWRRTREWPVEDAPHGDPVVHSWPLRTTDMKEVVQRWENSRNG